MVKADVLVLKLGHCPLHHGVVGGDPKLGRAGVPVYGVHEDPLAPACQSPHRPVRLAGQLSRSLSACAKPRSPASSRSPRRP